VVRTPPLKGSTNWQLSGRRPLPVHDRQHIAIVDRRAHSTDEWPTMGFNRRKMEDQRRAVAEKEAAGRRATEPPSRGRQASDQCLRRILVRK